MTAPATLPKFLLVLRRNLDGKQIECTCTLIGDTREYRPTNRYFRDIKAVSAALEASGIDSNRYGNELTKLANGSEISIEIDQNQAQKLDILQTETTE